MKRKNKKKKKKTSSRLPVCNLKLQQDTGAPLKNILLGIYSVSNMLSEINNDKMFIAH
jgi:hypothetical protein